MRPAIAVICLLCAPPALGAQASAAAAEPTSEFHRLIALGRSAVAAKDYAAAAAALEKAVALRPYDPEARYALGRAYGEDKRYQLAVEQLRQTLRLSPGHAGALMDLAAIDQNSGHFEQAAERYRAALSHGGGVRAERGLASLLARQGQSAEAQRSLRKLVEADPSDLESRYQLGLVLMQEGDCASAAAEFQEVARRDPSHRGALFNLGNCLNRIGRTAEAADAQGAFRAVAETERGLVDRQRRAYFLLLEADRLMERGDGVGGLRALEEALQLDPASARAHAMRGQALDAAGDPNGALASFLRSAQLDPRDPIVQVEAGRLLGLSHRMSEAISHLTEAARLDPLMPEPHLLLSAAYRALGKLDQAAHEEQEYRRLKAHKDGRIDQTPPGP